jgi:pimeloyl-ACP methyl ester carboxylesterase
MKSIKLYFEEYGDKNSEPLIILHGFFASSRNWRQIAKKLAEHCHVFVLDLRNHGSSPHDPEMDYPSMAGDLIAFMDEHGLERASVLGHSMGGKVAMWLALSSPERVNKLIVADISPVSYEHSFDHTMQALKDIPLSQISNRKQADEFLSAAIPELSYRMFLLQNLQLIDGKYNWRVDLDIFQKTAHHIIAFPQVTNSPYSDNALFIMGENPLYTNSEAIYRYFPQAEISVLEGANHWLHVDQPEAFLTNVIRFM